MKMIVQKNGKDHTITIHMPRLSFSDESKFIYLNQKVMCEIM